MLPDDPAVEPGLGFPSYASAFAEIIQHSKAQFAVGIFGDWGSGKTTLMRAIQKRLNEHDEVNQRENTLSPGKRLFTWEDLGAGSGGQGQGRTADLPLFSSKERRPVPSIPV